MNSRYKMPYELKEKIAGNMEKRYSDVRIKRRIFGTACAAAVLCIIAGTAVISSGGSVPVADNMPEETDVIEQYPDETIAITTDENTLCETAPNRFEPFTAEDIISGETAAEQLRSEICSVIKGDSFFMFPVAESSYADKTEYNGAYHIPVPVGTEVRSMGWGTVKELGKDTVYGNYIIIEHDGAGEFVYAHLSEFGDIASDSIVEPGTVIGKSGCSGFSPSEGTLLIRHLETHVQEMTYDDILLFNKQNEGQKYPVKISKMGCGYRLDIKESSVSLWRCDETPDRFYAFRTDDENADWLRIEGGLYIRNTITHVLDLTYDNVNDLAVIVSPGGTGITENYAYVIDGENLQLVPIDSGYQSYLDGLRVSVPNESRGGAFGSRLNEPILEESDNENGSFSSRYFFIEDNRLVIKAYAELDTNGFASNYAGTLNFGFSEKDYSLMYTDMSVEFYGGEWFLKCFDLISSYNTYIYWIEQYLSPVLDRISDEKMRAFTKQELLEIRVTDEQPQLMNMQMTSSDFFCNEVTNCIEGTVSYDLTVTAFSGEEKTESRSMYFVVTRDGDDYNISRVFDTTEKSLPEKITEFENFVNTEFSE